MDLFCSESIVYESDSTLYHLNKHQQNMGLGARSESTSQCSSLGAPTNSDVDADVDTDADAVESPANLSPNAVLCQMKDYVYIYASVDVESSATTPKTQSLLPPPPQQHQHQQQEQFEPAATTPSLQRVTHCAQERTTSLQHTIQHLDKQQGKPTPAAVSVNMAIGDPTFFTDRCLENALKAEEKHNQIVDTYFLTVQKDITPAMRKIVAEWMMEVCAEEKCQEEVVLLAINYMDRFLSSKSVRKTHLQILAAACLLLASKLREPSSYALSVDLLVVYTDNSIYKDDLIKWELYVLSRLGWDLSSVTPLDFLELLLMRLPIKRKNFPDINIGKIRGHAQAFISLAAKEHKFAKYSASTIAASSIAASMNGLKWHLCSGHNLHFLLSLMTDLTSVEQDQLQDCMLHMEAIFKEHSQNLQPFIVSIEPPSPPPPPQQTSAALYYQGRLKIHEAHQYQQQHRPPKIVIPSLPSDSVEQQHQHQHQQHCLRNALSSRRTQTCKMQAHAQNELKDVTF
ncbi:hypothetical protein KR038_010715 [Drosophila bunnanda]|nr:hypothetical protein KR038_010715 [Drosophila bunnanda]